MCRIRSWVQILSSHNVSVIMTAMAVTERTVEERTQSEQSYTASYGQSVAATERAMTSMERTVEESAYN